MPLIDLTRVGMAIGIALASKLIVRAARLPRIDPRRLLMQGDLLFGQREMRRRMDRENWSWFIGKRS
jgi:hypothetical protein